MLSKMRIRGNVTLVTNALRVLRATRRFCGRRGVVRQERIFLAHGKPNFVFIFSIGAMIG